MIWYKNFYLFLKSNEVSENIRYSILLNKIKNSGFTVLYNLLTTEKVQIEDTFISTFLSDPNPEANEELIDELFQIFLSKRSNLLGYFQIIFENVPGPVINPKLFIQFFSEECKKHKEEFISTLDNVLVFHSGENVFIEQAKYKPLDLHKSKFNEKIISKLFDVVIDDPSNFQAYCCFVCIANSFPLIFSSDPICVIFSVLPAFNNYKLIFERKNSNENDDLKNKKIKASITAISFLLFTLNSIKVMDAFIPWFFQNYKHLTMSQILCFFIVFVMISSTKYSSYLYALYIRYDFINVCTDIIYNRGVSEDLFGINLNYFMYNILHNFFNQAFTLIRSPAIEHYLSTDNLFNESSGKYITNLIQLHEISDKQVFKITRPLTNIMVGTLLTKYSWIYQYILNQWTFPLLADHFSILAETVNNLQNGDENHLKEFYKSKYELFDEAARKLLIKMIPDIIMRFRRPANRLAKIYRAINLTSDNCSYYFEIIRQALLFIEQKFLYFAHSTH